MGRARGPGKGGRDIFSRYGQSKTHSQQNSSWQERVENQEKRQDETLSSSTKQNYVDHEKWMAQQAAKSVHEVTPSSPDEMDKAKNLPPEDVDEAVKAAMSFARNIFSKYSSKESEVDKGQEAEHDQGEEH